MALPSRYGIDKKINSMGGLSAYENGGPGSGNFGHSGRPGEIGGSSKTGSYEQLSGPAKTRGEYMQKDASEDCKTEFSDVYGALSDHAYWIADEGGFADGYEARDYEALGDKYAGICDRSRSRGYVTQHDLVGMLKRTRKEAEPYGLIDGSGSTDKMNDFLVKYDMDDKLNSVSDVFENGGKGSGNFGHSGRPGEVGGSGKGSGGSNSKNIDEEIEKTKKAIEGLGEFLGSIPPSGILSSEMEGIEKASKELEKARKKLEKLEKEKKGSGKKQSGEISLKGKSLYEKVHMIEAGDEVHITPKDNLPNFDRKIKVDYIQDGTIHYGSSETRDGYTYPAWAIKDITKIIRKKSSYSGEKMMGMPSRYGIDKKINSMAGLSAYENGGKGSGNFGHAGRPGEVGGSGKGTGASSGSGYVPKHKKDMRIREAILKSITGQKELQDRAKVVQEDIEDRIGQKVKEGEEYTALDEALKERFKFFHGEDGTEYTYDKGNGMITKTNPKTGDQEVVTKQKKDYGSEKSGVSKRDGSGIGNEFADLTAELETARTNLKMLKEDKGKAYKDLSGRTRFMDRSAEISRSLHYAQLLGKSRVSKETKQLLKEMESELRSIRDEYDKLGTDKYFDPDLNHEN